MAKKKNFDYFEYFVNTASIICEASDFLHAMLKNYNASAIKENMDKMHEIEHRSDELKHDMTSHLMHEFITPIEREDILELGNKLDDVVDGLDDAVRRLYMYNVKTIRADALRLSEMIVKSAYALKDAMVEFKNFKSSKTIKNFIIAVNTVESDSDAIHCEAFHSLFSGETDTRELMVWVNVLDDLENCIDDCEDAVDIVETVIMKNS